MANAKKTIENLVEEADELRKAILEQRRARETAAAEDAERVQRAQLEAEIARLKSELAAETAVTEAQGSASVVPIVDTTVAVATAKSVAEVAGDVAAADKKKEN